MLFTSLEEQASKFLQEEDFTRAEIIYSQLVTEFPARHQGWTGLAKVATETAQWELALARWSKVIEQFPQIAYAYAYKGNTLLRLGKFTSANLLFEQLSQKFPEKHQGWIGLAHVATKTEQWEQALTLWSRVIEQFPQFADSYVQQGNVLLQLGKFERANSVFEQLTQKFPQREEGWTGLAHVATKTKQWEQALTRWSKVIEQFPQVAYAYAYKGNVLLQLGKFESANLLFEQLSQKFPEKRQGWIGLAHVATKTEQWEQALTRWSKVIEQFPQVAYAYAYKGNTLLQLGKFESANSAFEQLSKKFPEKHQGWIGLARVAIKTEQWELALSVVNQGITNFPNNLELQLQKGNILIELKEFAQANSIFQWLYTQQPDSLVVLEKLTIIATQINTWQEVKLKWQNFIDNQDWASTNKKQDYDWIERLNISFDLLYRSKNIQGCQFLTNLVATRVKQHPQLAIWQANLFYEKGLYNLANRVLNGAIKRYSAYADKISFQLALNAWNTFDIAKVIDICEKIGAVNDADKASLKNYYAFLIMLSQALIRSDQESKAKETLTKAIFEFKSNVKAYILLFEIYCFSDHNYEKALEVCNLADEQAIWHKQIEFYKTLALSALGKHQSALTVIDDYLKLHPADKLAKIYRVQLLRNNGQYKSSLKELNQIYIADGFEPIFSKGDKCELNIAQIQCTPQYKIASSEMVSIIMTHYQRDELLPISIESSLNQTYSNLELIIVDDGGSDETWNWLQKLAAQDERIKLLKMPQNVGTYVAKNEGLLHARGKYITFKDSDDWSHPQLLETQIKILQNPDLKAVASGFIRIDQESNIEFKPEKPLDLAHITLCIKRDPVFKTIGFFDAVRAVADTEYINRIKLIWGANAVKVIDSPLLLMTRSEQSITGGGKLGFRWYGDRPICLRYWHDAQQWHRIMAANQIDPYLPHPLDYRRFDVAQDLLP